MAYFSVKVRFSSHATMGRFFLSLYVGRMTENLSPELFVGAMIVFCAGIEESEKKETRNWR